MHLVTVAPQSLTRRQVDVAPSTTVSAVALGVGAPTRRYGRIRSFALAATVMLETGERGSLSQAADGIQAHFHVSDFWIGALPTAMTLDRRHRRRSRSATSPITCRRTYLLAGAMASGPLVVGTRTRSRRRSSSCSSPGSASASSRRTAPASISLLSDYYPVQRPCEAHRPLPLGARSSAARSASGSRQCSSTLGLASAFWMWIPFGIATVIVLLRDAGTGTRCAGRRLRRRAGRRDGHGT